MCVFDRVMDASLYSDILNQTLTCIPFLLNAFPDGQQFMQDDDPKHTTQAARSYFITQSINWWLTPAESPDLNPIDNLWHELKEFIRREVKRNT